MNEDSKTGRMIPDLSQLRLDTLLRELIDRAAQVIESQERIHRLLDAVVSVASDLSLPVVLRRIVQSSIDLVGARYAAMGVLAADRNSLREFVYIGIDDQHGEIIGDLPHGKGILGLLIKHPQPIRLTDLTRHPQSYGFPPNHPPMTSFLGVPVHVRGEVFGNLYLTEKKGGGDFTEDDQTVVVALAAAAGIAIENARLYELTRQRGAWLRASNQLTEVLLTGQSASSALDSTARHAHRVSGAPFVAIALPDETAATLVFEVIEAAENLTDVADHRATTADGVLGRVYTKNEARIVDDLGQTAGNPPISWIGEAPAGLKDLGSALLVPLAAGHRTLGVLVIAKRRDQLPFGEPELEMVRTFAAHSALAIEFARAQEDRQRLAVLEDRDRIARDLHDLVIQRLFAIALGLQGLARLVARPEVRKRIAGFVGELDQTIGEIRRSILTLQEPRSGPASLRGELLRVIQQATSQLGYEPTLSIDGPVDSLVPDDIRPDLLATLRESLSNAARHAEAHAVRVTVTVDRKGTQLQLVVRDDGSGMPSQLASRNGLADVSQRATRWGGTCDIASAPDRGTTITWTVPLVNT